MSFTFSAKNRVRNTTSVRKSVMHKNHKARNKISRRSFSFEPLEDRIVLDSTTVFNEIMYHPADPAEPEWIELHNQMSVDMDLSGWSLSDGVDFIFPQGTVIPKDGYLVIASDPVALQNNTGFAGALGPFTGSLANNGERLQLSNNNDRVMNELDYRDSGDWPVAPDGSGVTLAKIDEGTSTELASNWAHSQFTGGTPGAENFPAQPQVTTPLINFDSNWKYDDNGVDLGTTWKDSGFVDNGWTSGDGLFFDTTATLPLPSNTALNTGVQTYYFRNTFQYNGTNIADSLELQSIVDDGAVFYLNGQEIHRVNMPAGSIDFNTQALNPIGDATLDIPISIAPTQLNIGTNVLAVEVHQNSSSLVELPIANASFEVDAPHPLNGPTGWISSNINTTGNTRVYFTEHAGAQGTSLPYPDGARALGVRSNDGQPMAIYQDLGAVQEATYHVSFSVADRYVSRWLNYKVELVAVDGLNNETVLISEDSALNQDIRPINGSTSHPHSPALVGIQGDWLEVDLQTVAGAAIVGQTLRLRFTTSATSTGDAGGPFDHALDDVKVSVAVPSGTTDAVFGASLNVTENIPVVGTSSLAFNEVAGANDAAFFIELINNGNSAINLDGIILNSSDPLQNSYTFPSTNLNAGELLAIDETTLGFTVADGDRIFIYSPTETSVLDAVSVKSTLRGKMSDGEGTWLRPDVATPGTPNSFDINDDIVINEIMYHQRPDLGTPDIPGTFSTTTILPFDANWRYNESGDNLGLGWEDATHVGEPNWQSGIGPLGFDETPAALPMTLQTILTDPDLNSPFVFTHYFETDFTLTQNEIDAIDELQIQHLLDDGAVIYINGIEVLRPGMPGGVITSSTTANLPGVGDASLSSLTTIPKENLAVGTNRISVEVHQQTTGSSDIVMGIELLAAIELTPFIPGQPFTENPEEWIEIYNRNSTETIDLTGWDLNEAIDFDFPDNTFLGPNEYLVIAKDPVAMSAQYPAITVLGPYSGTLSNNNEQIELRDAVNNPVDTVHYFDGGRWDRFADGDGASLELRDPNSDNSKGEAWAASKEEDNSTWQTYTYRGIANPTIPGEPAVWNEFALGFLDGVGRALIDDISVVQDPDGTPVELIQNGSFDSGDASTWRLLGNHQNSEVIDDGGNFVLNLKSEGATEYQWNQIETTFLGNTPIANGQEYEVSFRAKWLQGSQQINSRFYFNRLPNTTLLEVPQDSGTPGAQNSNFETNIGPTYENLKSTPVAPLANEPVTISVDADDPDGISQMTLWYRPDGGVWTSTTMSLGAGNTYSASIPGQPANTVVQFYVEGIDTPGAMSQFPAEGPNSRALYEVTDGQDNQALLQSFRVIMLQSDNDHLHDSFNALSNERLGATIVYENEVFYDVGVRLKGSFVGRDAARVGFNISFNSDQLFRGVHDKVAVDRSTHAVLGVDEILVKHIANQAGGIPGMYDDLIHFISPRTQDTGTASIRMAAFDEVYLDSQFKNGSDGTVYEYEVLRWATTTADGNPESLKNAGGLGDPNGWNGIDFQDLGDDKEAYRWTNLIVSSRTKDDYSSIIQVGEAFSQSGQAFADATAEILDIDEWMRTSAFQSLVGPTDAYYTGGAPHNFRLYARPEDGKVLYMPWDWDSSFSRSTSASVIGGTKLGQLVNIPVNKRSYYGHILDIIDTTYNTSYMSQWTTHYGDQAGQNFSNRLNYIGSRASFVTNAVSADFPQVSFGVNTTSPLVVADTVATVEGTGWVNVREIRLAGSSEPLEVSWNTSGGANADTWSVTLPIPFGSDTYTFEAYDFQGNLIGSDTIDIESTVSARPLQDFLRVTEVHYNPSVANDATEFIELKNISATETLDLTGVQITEGPSSTFNFTGSNVTSLLPGEFVLVVKDSTQFSTIGSHYPGVSAAIIAGQFAGSLSNGGEEIEIIDDTGAIIQQFTYEDGEGVGEEEWHKETDNFGFSLVTVDTSGDYNLPTNWDSSALIGGSPGADDPTGLSADFDGSGEVNASDLAILLSNYGTAVAANRSIGDANHDQKVSLQDLLILKKTFGDSISSAPPAAAAASLSVSVNESNATKNEATVDRVITKVITERQSPEQEVALPIRRSSQRIAKTVDQVHETSFSITDLRIRNNPLHRARRGHQAEMRIQLFSRSPNE